MRAPAFRAVVLIAALLAAGWTSELTAQDQHAVAFEGHFQGFTVEDGASVSAMNVFITPVGYRLPLGDQVVSDFYGAWARGQVELDDRTYVINGIVDTQVKLRVQATPWALLSLSASLPTGNAQHDDEEAIVAGVLSSDLFGFRESVWGNGLGVTAGVATATRLGPTTGLGIGASYRVSDEFEPNFGSNLTYQPGNETRVRVGLDQTLGQTGKLTVGYTFQNFQEDQSSPTGGPLANLFQAGNRHMADGTLGFRAGRHVLNFYGMYLSRANGDLRLSFVDAQDNVLPGDTIVATSSQKLAAAGVTATLAMGTTSLRASADIRVQDRTNPPVLSAEPASEEGSGWIAGFGLELPLRMGPRAALVPSARVLTGSFKDVGDVDRSLTGFEGGIVLRIQLGG